jgi:hypothetical protein
MIVAKQEKNRKRCVCRGETAEPKRQRALAHALKPNPAISASIATLAALQAKDAQTKHTLTNTATTVAPYTAPTELLRNERDKRIKSTTPHHGRFQPEPANATSTLRGWSHKRSTMLQRVTANQTAQCAFYKTNVRYQWQIQMSDTNVGSK